MKKKYYNDAFIGNDNLTASFTKYGELLRLYYPLPDYRQYMEFMHIGVKINDSNIIYLHDDINNRYNQYYTEDTNILNTEIENTYFNLFVKQTDCAIMDKDVLIKKYRFENRNHVDLDVKLLLHSKVLSTYNNAAGSIITNNSLVQYSHNFMSIITSDMDIESYQLNDVDRNITSGILVDKDYIGMSPDSAIRYDLGIIKAGEAKEFNILMYLKYDFDKLSEVQDIIKSLKAIDYDKEIQKTEQYWKKFLAKHDLLKIKSDGSEYMDKLIKVYKRSILFIPILMNEETGGVSASLEIDEERDKCGRYSYCWPRDAVMIYNSYDNLAFDDITEKFYSIFLEKCQSRNGMWEQRFYTDGRLAPCWGYQIDETAMVVWGAYKHYHRMKDMHGIANKDFLVDRLRMLENAMRFIEKYTNNILDIPEIVKDDKEKQKLNDKYSYSDEDKIHLHQSYDLWEMNEGIHLYSLSAIYAAFRSMIAIYDELEDELKLIRGYKEAQAIEDLKRKYEIRMREIRKFILDHLYDKQKNVFVRNTNDRLIDISILGAIIPFEVFDPEDDIVKNTVEQINMTLRTYSGGYLRFQGDTYIGGNYPWIIATAWMGLYYKKTENKEKFAECMNFIVNSANMHGLLSEQSASDYSDRWVSGLGWSHAMFIEMLVE